MSPLARFEARCRAAFEAKPAKAQILRAALHVAGLEHMHAAIAAGDSVRSEACGRGLLAVEHAYVAAKAAS